MSKLPPDYSFVRDGLPLQDWLGKLVDNAKRTRIRAGEALQAMEWGLPSMHTDWNDLAPFPDTVAQSRRFAVALREVFASDSFPAPPFLEKLGGLRLGLARDWLERVEQWTEQTNARDSKYDRIANRLAKSIQSSDDETEKSKSKERLAKLSAMYIAGSCQDASEDPFLQAESIAPSGIAASRIFQILDVELLAAPAVLEAFLQDSKLRWDALAILQRCGPAAVDWAPVLLRDFDQLARNRGKVYCFDAAAALGSVGQGNAAIVAAMISRLSHDKPIVRGAAADVLQHMAGEVCDRNVEICELLVPMLEDEATATNALLAVASIGRNIHAIRTKVLALAAPQPPKLRAYPGYPDMQYDQAMHTRGIALSAIEFLTAYPDECLPVLIDALDSFEEFDPDEGYHGPHARVANLIALFGPAAEPAVLPLARHLNDEPDEIPSAMFDCLAAIGPAAYAALPTLRKLYEKFPPDEPAKADEPVDRDDDPIGWLIRQIAAELPPTPE